MSSAVQMLQFGKNGPRTALARDSACLRCKRNKRKCDAAKPACGGCVHLGRELECRYPRRKAPQTSSSSSRALQRVPPNLMGSGVILPEIVVTDHNVEWWKLNEIPVTLNDFLLTTFLNHTPQLYFEDLAPSILSRMRRFPPSHASYPHPALVYAMQLIGSFCLSSPSHPARVERRAKWDSAAIESMFLAKSRKLMFTGPTNPENLVDFLIAMGLISRYLFWTTRLVEGYDQSIGAMRLAMHCNLHSIPSLKVSDYSPSVLPPPENDMEVRDRMAAFWFTFILDRGGRVARGRRVIAPDEIIDTVFPPNVKGLASTSDPALETVRTLIGSSATNASANTIFVMKVKAGAIFDLVGQLVHKLNDLGATKFADISEPLYHEFCATEDALQQFINSLPSAPPTWLSSSTYSVPSESVLADLACLQTLCQGSFVQLYTPFTHHDKQSRETVSSAVREIIRVSRILAGTNEVYWHLSVQFPWRDACLFLQDETNTMLNAGQVTPEEIRDISVARKDMEHLVNMMARLCGPHRPNHSSLKFMKDLLAKNADAIHRLDADLPNAS